MAARVAVVGAGISGAACARVLHATGVDVDVRDRGNIHGGRMATPTLHRRRTDMGAAYFTAKDDTFNPVVADWLGRGLVHEWTDTFAVFSADGRSETSGPTRYGSRDGLRSLVDDLFPAPVRVGSEVRALGDLDHDAVVLAMPDPQARALAGDVADWVEYDPVLAIALAWPQRAWTPFDAAFVNDDPDLTLVADDGARRGDGVPVLVAHTTAARAVEHLAAPTGAIPAVLDALHRLLGIDIEPEWTHACRWTFAKPAGTHGDQPYGLVTSGSRLLGLCTDSWCPSGAPRIESAWLSGHRLGTELARRLGNLRGVAAEQR